MLLGVLLTGCAATPVSTPVSTAVDASASPDASPTADSVESARAEAVSRLDEMRAPWETKVTADAAPEAGRSLASVTAELLQVLQDRLGAPSVLEPDGEPMDPAAASAYAAEIDRRAAAGLDPTTGGAFHADGSDAVAGAPAPVPVDQHEALLQAATGEADAAGSYLPAAAKMAASIGFALTQFDAHVVGQCGLPKEEWMTPDLFAVQCGTEPSAWINRSRDVYAEYMLDPGLMSVIRHEIAHYELATKCYFGFDYAPDVEYEAITSSYAVLFLGADYDALQAAARDREAYRMSDASDQAARDLHARPTDPTAGCGQEE